LAYIKKNKIYLLRRVAVITGCILCTVITLSACYVLYNNRSLRKAANISKNGSNMSQSNNVQIVRAKLSMSKGELLDPSKVELIEVPGELVPQGAITNFSKLNNMRLKREIAAKEFLNGMDLMTKDAVCEEGDRLMEHNFSEGAVPAAVSEGSTIDIKLFVKGGEDSLVVSKAEVISRTDNLLSFYMDGREQEYIKEAASEGMLFAVQYIDTSQEASAVTYVPLFYKERE
jgi:hypothetical protein